MTAIFAIGGGGHSQERPGSDSNCSLMSGFFSINSSDRAGNRFVGPSPGTSDSDQIRSTLSRAQPVRGLESDARTTRRSLADQSSRHPKIS